MSWFKESWQNSGFRPTWLTWLTLALMGVLYPAISVLFSEDPSVTLRSLNDTMRLIMLLGTIVIQWIGFIIIVAAVELERTGLQGLGFKRIRAIDFAWAGAFLLASNLLLSGLAWVLAQMGMPMSGDIKFLIPEDAVGRVVWVGVSITAGVVEETAFRGYLMTRFRLLGKLRSWVAPAIISSIIFGSLHAYQGLPGMIVITAYGLLFALLYIRTGSIWPCIIAHFFQDLSALFIPQ